MYERLRRQALDRCDWKGRRDESTALQCLEAWRYEDDGQANNNNFVTRSISSESELTAWLRQSPPHQAPGKLLGGIRLLVCDRTQYTPLDFRLSLPAFKSIEKAFDLSAMTVPTFGSEAEREPQSAKADKKDTILKAPQKREIFNWGLSLSYDVQSSTTSGFLYGTYVGKLGVGQDADLYRSILRFVGSIQAADPGWDHPSLLPCLFLSEHLTSTIEFSTKGKVLTETVNIEHQLGVTKVGQSSYLPAKDPKHTSISQDQPLAQVQHMVNPYLPSLESARVLSREETEALTVRINTQSTRILFTARSPEWNLACARFLLDILDEITPKLVDQHERYIHECRQLLEYNITLAEAAASNIAVIKERMALQLNVLYNFVAQLDNQTSAELAASASRDSTSMKILAFISALFLPGNFISAMFSMDMFDWKGNDSDAAFSNKFWIYWAATVPLTAVTVMGWAAWWYFELGRFDRKIKSIQGRPQTEGMMKQAP